MGKQCNDWPELTDELVAKVRAYYSANGKEGIARFLGLSVVDGAVLCHFARRGRKLLLTKEERLASVLKAASARRGRVIDWPEITEELAAKAQAYYRTNGRGGLARFLGIPVGDIAALRYFARNGRALTITAEEKKAACSKRLIARHGINWPEMTEELAAKAQTYYSANGMKGLAGHLGIEASDFTILKYFARNGRKMLLTKEEKRQRRALLPKAQSFVPGKLNKWPPPGDELIAKAQAYYRANGKQGLAKYLGIAAVDMTVMRYFAKHGKELVRTDEERRALYHRAQRKANLQSWADKRAENVYSAG